MYRNIILIFSIVYLVTESTGRQIEDGRIIAYENWDDYKAEFNKTFQREFMETRCKEAYEANCCRIRRHNAAADKGEFGYKLRANYLADLSERQYLGSYLRLLKSPRNETSDPVSDLVGAGHSLSESVNIPDRLDWRELGFTTSSMNQRSCGSCYAFSIADSISAQVYKRIGKIIQLSTQQMVDCSISSGNKGCLGGSLRNTFKYLQTSGGLMRDVDYPYISRQNVCSDQPQLAVVNVTTWAILPPHDESILRRAVAEIGPIPVSINASPKTFQLYSHGVYDDPECSTKSVNHAMLIVGYTPDYWILKNWWGDNWGDRGYMHIKRDKNICGLSNYAAYAIV